MLAVERRFARSDHPIRIQTAVEIRARDEYWLCILLKAVKRLRRHQVPFLGKLSGNLKHIPPQTIDDGS